MVASISFALTGGESPDRGCHHEGSRRGDYVMAELHLEECLGIERRLGSRRCVAHAPALLSDIADRQGGPLRSRRLLEESLLEFGQVGEQAEARRVLSELERLRLP